VRFTENKGQWPDHVLYRTMLPNGALFVERSAFTYVLQTGGATHAHGTAETAQLHEPYRAHAFKVSFVGGEARSASGALTQAHYENFFLGDDPAMWGTGCPVHGEVVLHEVWPGIDLRIDGRTGLKYEVLVSPGADPAAVRFHYEGQDLLALKDGALVVRTSAGEVVEEAPISFQDTPLRKEIPSHYLLHGDEVGFSFPQGYARELPLTIDPTISFASYSGSSADNFGFTATYDNEGHLYGGGIVFDVGYPSTTGVLDASFNGGQIDVGISKWTLDGSALVWSTYIGGTGNEAPHSMVVNADDELYVFGHTGSFNFPSTQNCFDDTFGGGGPVVFSIQYGYGHPNGTDMFVTHLNAAATAMIGSTFVGGTGNDGLNDQGSLAHNYGDSFRGEIIVDLNGDPVVATTTGSLDLPIVGGPQPAAGGGGQDGYCFRLDPSLSSMSWSTYIGGSGLDAAFGVQVDSGGDLFVTGGTESHDLPMAGDPYRSTFSGGTDAFIMRYGAAGGLVGSTYLGTSSFDQSYFVQLNTSDEVFVVGQTRGDYPITPGKYAVHGSSQFIHKLDHSLSTSLWSTCFGNGSIVQDLSPTAFLVSDCGQIYFSGWGGAVNSYAGNPLSTTNGLAVTADAYQHTTDGSDLYLMLLEPEATALNYATFFGGASSPEHVDGGTSRFDKNGTVYQAVCAGCRNHDDFPATSEAWSTTNNSTGCNLGVMKFELARGTASIAIDGPSTLCFPATAQLINNSVGGNTYDWNLGNGVFSHEEEPLAEYTAEGVFTITLILTDNTGCHGPDTASIEITMLPPTHVIIDPVAPFCLDSLVELHASGGDTYLWSPAEGLDDPTSADPLLSTITGGQWSVEITGLCGTDRDSVLVLPAAQSGSAGADEKLCVGTSVTLSATGGGSYQWDEDQTLSTLTGNAPVATPLDTTTYRVTITTPEGCIVQDSVLVQVVMGTAEPAHFDTLLCIGENVRLVAPDGDTYAWNANSSISDTAVQGPIMSPTVPTTYVVTVTNVCGTMKDTAFVDVAIPVAEAWPDTVVCPGVPVGLFASEGALHQWSPAELFDDPAARYPMARIFENTVAVVTITDTHGCAATASVTLGAFPPVVVDAGPDHIIEFGEHASLHAIGRSGPGPHLDMSFVWEPPSTLDNDTIADPVAYTQETTAYTVTVTNSNGCQASDVVNVILPGTLFIPNTFTPNGDGYNDVFGAWGKDLSDLELWIYNRWGELIWSTAQLSGRWDGTVDGKESPIDTYVWKVKATELSGREHALVGHVNLLR
jgi:gliding motility-associated-like protein